MTTTDLPATTDEPVLDAHVAGSLSPSRAADFMTCPLLYRFRVIDRIPERPSVAAAQGTVVHTVLEQLFDLPPAERTPERAAGLVRPAWQRLLEAEPDLAAEVRGGPVPGADAARDRVPGPDLEALEVSARELLARYFQLEDPRRLEPAERELLVDVTLDSGLRLRGFVDRLDVAPTGEMRVVDYKTGRAPAATFEARALFQMRFYALVLWRLHGRVPRMLQLLYLGSGEVIRYEPDEADLRAMQRKLEALWAAIRRATETGDWRPRPGPLCDWCDHKESRCPAWGGTLPPLPGTSAAAPEVPGPRPPRERR